VAELKGDRVTQVLVGLLFVGAVVMGWDEVTESRLLLEGSSAPDFAVETLAGPPVTLSGLKGQVVVVDFWATWCGPCRDEMPMLLETAQAYAARGVVLVMVSNDDLSGQREAVTAYARQEPRLAPHAAFGTPELGAAYRVRALPTLYVVDRQGRVATARAGTVARWQLDRWLDQALAQ
jgi:thiol-disulfide isomerase/thioredoxin